MSRLIARRLSRLEAQPAACRRVEFRVVYYGEPAPVEDDSWTLTLWLHQPGCDDVEHVRACGPWPPAPGGAP